MEETGVVANVLNTPATASVCNWGWSEYFHIPRLVSMNFTGFQKTKIKIKLPVW
jgi:hypothetical protein